MHQPIFTPMFAREMSSKLLDQILARIEDPDLRDLLHCQAYFAHYHQQLVAGQVDGAVEADAPAWLGLSLKLIEVGHAN